MGDRRESTEGAIWFVGLSWEKSEVAAECHLLIHEIVPGECIKKKKKRPVYWKKDSNYSVFSRAISASVHLMNVIRNPFRANRYKSEL